MTHSIDPWVDPRDRLNAVLACRHGAREIWVGRRSRLGYGVGGLGGEPEVRQRLMQIAAALPEAAGAPPFSELSSVRWDIDDPLLVLDKTERMIVGTLPGVYGSASPLLDSTTLGTRLLSRLLVVQSIAGRLGRWATRDEEIEDARIARALYRRAGDRDRSQYDQILGIAEELEKGGRFEEAAICWLDADRIKRTASGLFRAAAALHQLGAQVEARWAIRACLLEDLTSFDTPEQLLLAHQLESRIAGALRTKNGAARRITEGPPPLLPRRSLAASDEMDTEVAIVSRRPTPFDPSKQGGSTT